MHVTLTILRNENVYSFTLTGHSRMLHVSHSHSVDSLSRKHSALETVCLSASLTVDESKHNLLQKYIAAAVQTLNTNGKEETSTDKLLVNSATEFESLGRLIFAQVVPIQIQTQIRLLPFGSLLEIVTNDLNFPWELLHDGQDFLSQRHCVARLPIVTRPPEYHIQPQAKPKISCLLLGNPTGDLPTTEVEIQSIAEILYTVRDRVHYRTFFGKIITSTHLQELLASQEYDLVHIACHARPGALKLADGWFDTHQFCKGLQNHPLIVLSACAAIQAAPSSVEFSSLTQNVQSFGTALVQSGAMAVIGMLWPIAADATQQWSKAFYQQIVMGATVSDALRTSRVAVCKQGRMDASWLAPVLYGNPLHRVIPNALKEGVGTLLLFRFTEQMVDRRQIQDAKANDLQRYLSTLCEHITSYGGSILYANSEGLLAVFGLYQSLDSDAIQAISSARDVRKLALDWHVTMPRSVIASGEMLVSVQGLKSGVATTSATTVPLLFGKPVTDANRLINLVTPGQIVVNQLARERCKEHFHFRPLSDADSNETYSIAFEVILAPVDITSVRETLNLQVTVGIHDELQLLRNAWKATMEGCGQLLAIRGEAGIGKSHLIMSFKRSINATERQWIQINCTAEIENTPYSLLNRLFHNLLDLPEYATPEQINSAIRHAYRRNTITDGTNTGVDTSLLADLLGDQQQDLRLQEQSVYQHQLYLLLRTLLVQKLEQGALILVLEDAHWSDSASIAVLTHFVNNIQEAPILLLLAYRNGWDVPWHAKPYAQNIHLTQFDVETRRQYIASLLGSTYLPDELLSLSERSSGNPLFLSEILVTLVEKGLLVAKNATVKEVGAGSDDIEHWQLRGILEPAELPDTVQRIIEMRLDQLEPETRTVLEMASVVGTSFTHDMLLWGHPEAESKLFEHLKTLVDHDFLRQRWGSNQYEFRHALIRDVTYVRTTLAHRQLWHRRVAERLEQRTSQTRQTITELALHYYFSLVENHSAGVRQEETPVLNHESDPSVVERALEYLLQSGQDALARYAAREAVTFYTRAQWVNKLRPRNTTRQSVIQTGLGHAYRLQNNFNKAIEGYEEAHAAFHRQPLSSEIRPQVAEVARWLARLHMWRADYTQAEAWVTTGLAHVQTSEQPKCRVATALLNIQAGSIYYNRGDYPAAEHYCRQGLAIAAACKDDEAIAEANLVLGAIMQSLGNYVASLAAYAECMTIQERLQNLYEINRIKMNLGVIHFLQADWSRSLSYYGEALRFWREIDEQNLLAGMAINMGLVEHYKGNWDLARDYYQQALDCGHLIGNSKWLARAHNNLGTMYILMDRWEDAREHIVTSWDLLETYNIQDLMADVRCSQALLSLSVQDWESAQRLVAEAITIAPETALPLDRAIALRIRGQIYLGREELNLALESFIASLDILGRLKDKYEIARTYYQLALAREMSNEIAESLRLCNQVLTIFLELDAKHDLAMANELRARLVQWRPDQ